MAALDFRRFDALTFDCYGTLIDWERGIIAALRPVLARHQLDAGDDEVLETYARHEAALERGAYLPYRQILGGAFSGLAQRYGFTPTEEEVRAFTESIGDWPPFDDSAPALTRLKQRLKLGVITNCDDDLFAKSNVRLNVTFDWIVTAQQARTYKPSLRNFELALETIGLPRHRILHVAQSLFHDHVPAKRLGLSTVWVNRRRGRSGFGATPPASAMPDLEVQDMRTLADLALAPAG